jgi:hypothetical protein
MKMTNAIDALGLIISKMVFAMRFFTLVVLNTIPQTALTVFLVII